VPHANDGAQLQLTPLLAVSFDTMAAILAVAPSSNVAGGAAAKVTAIACGCVPPPPPDEEEPPPPHPAATTKIPSVTRRSGFLMAIPLMSACDLWPGFSSPYDTHSPSFPIASLSPNFQKHYSPPVQPTCPPGQSPPSAFRSAPPVAHLPGGALGSPLCTRKKQIGSPRRSLFRQFSYLTT
jgi:hypothetical protein